MSIPCRCNATTVTRCQRIYPVLVCPTPVIVAAPTTATPNQSVITANPNGIGLQAPLARTHDGNTSGPSYGGFDTGNNDNAAINVVLEYRFNAPVDRVIQLRLWNNGGGNLGDADGIATATVCFLDGSGGTLGNSPTGTYQLIGTNGPGPNAMNIDGLASPIHGVRVIRWTQIVGLLGGAPDIIWRNVNLRLRYEATLTWACADIQIQAKIEGLDPGLVYANGVLTQTNGPHTMTFSAPENFRGRIITNRPANFSTLDLNDGTVVTITGNQANTFSVDFTTYEYVPGNPVFLFLCDGEPAWYDTDGNVVDITNLVDCE